MRRNVSEFEQLVAGCMSYIVELSWNELIEGRRKTWAWCCYRPGRLLSPGRAYMWHCCEHRRYWGDECFWGGGECLGGRGVSCRHNRMVLRPVGSGAVCLKAPLWVHRVVSSRVWGHFTVAQTSWQWCKWIRVWNWSRLSFMGCHTANISSKSVWNINYCHLKQIIKHIY